VYVQRLDRSHFRKAYYGATKYECITQAKAAEEAAARTINPKSVTLGDWLETWLRTRREQRIVRPRTSDSYEEHLQRIIPALERVPLAGLSSWQIQSWLDEQLANGLGLRTVRSSWATLPAALQRAKQLRLDAENEAAADFIELPAHIAKPAKHLEPSELRRLQDWLFRALSSSEKHWQAAQATLLLLGLTSGARNGEILALAWPEVVLDPGAVGGRIHICRVLQRVRDHDAAPRVHTNGVLIRPKKLLVGTPKTRAGDRWIELFPEVAAALQAERDRQRLAQWKPLPVGDLVFRTRAGTPLSDTYLNRLMKDACAGAGIESRSFYAFRHTVASTGYQAGESDVSIAEMLGHADPSMAKRTYAHIAEEYRVPRMEKMRAIMLQSDPSVAE
jgi:integrase